MQWLKGALVVSSAAMFAAAFSVEGCSSNPTKGDGGPDVKIAELSRRFSEPAAGSQTAVMEPVIVHYRGEPITETFINILETGRGQRLVTVIELLSPSNKFSGEGQNATSANLRRLSAS